MIDFRDLCSELADSVELLLEMRAVDAKPMAITEDRLSRARAALAQPEPEILPKNCWLDDEPDIWPSPCVFEDPEEAISNCAHASVLHSEGKCKTDCQHYRQPTSGTH